jgi:hypothetical protein
VVAILASLVGLLVGVLVGRGLSARGITAQNALEGRQAVAYTVFFVAAVVGLGIYLKPASLQPPVVLSLYGEALLVPGMLFLACFGLSLLVVLEWPGRKDAVRRRSLLTGSILLLVCLAVLGFRAVPVTSILGESSILDGVVMQTTSYTCAPASVATIARFVLGDSFATERSMIPLTRTNRWGTTTLRELKAIRALGLGARFSNRLTVDSIIALGLPAVLHVDEPVATGTTIRHAVALLGVDTAASTVSVGNPLRGLQVVRVDELEDYWSGEAVLVELERGGN